MRIVRTESLSNLLANVIVPYLALPSVRDILEIHLSSDETTFLQARFLVGPSTLPDDCVNIHRIAKYISFNLSKLTGMNFERATTLPDNF